MIYLILTICFDNKDSKLVSANTKFAVNLYKELTATDAGSIFMSPISVIFALGMTYLGARGDTASQMRQALFLDDVDQKDLNEAFDSIRSSVASKDGAYTLCMANRLFGDKSINVIRDYLEESRKYFGAELATVDFM